MSTDPAPGDSLVDAFWGVARRLRGLSRESLAPQGLTPAMARGMLVLLRHGPMRPGQLSQHLHIAARSATEVVDALAERGLLERSPDPHDRRATLLHATADGERLGKTLGELRAQEARDMFAVLSATDRAHLARILRKLSD